MPLKGRKMHKGKERQMETKAQIRETEKRKGEETKGNLMMLTKKQRAKGADSK